MITRIAHIDESMVRDIIELGKKFYGLTGLNGTFHYDTFVRFWNEYLGRGMGSMWIYQENGHVEGAIGMTIGMSIMDGTSNAEELFWFVDPTKRGTAGIRLFRAAEEWAREMKLDRILMGHMSMIAPNKVGDFYLSQGFKALHTIYVKELHK